jgi:DNA sulfur modification protein DndD
MDAPLSAFDRERIKRITDILPKSADQIMMFIKDTDGLEAKKYLSNFIGAEYVINQEKTPNGKASEIHSVIERVK